MSLSMVLLVYWLGGQLGICRLLSRHNRHRPSSVHRWLSSHCYFRTCAHPPPVAPVIMQSHTAGNAVYLPEAFLSSSLPFFFRARQSDSACVILLSRRFVLLAHQGLKSFACAFSFPSAELQASLFRNKVHDYSPTSPLSSVDTTMA